MAPLAHTLALLAMTVVATAAIQVVPLDMAMNSFDDQYLECSAEMSENLSELQSSDFLKNPEFVNNWENATKTWRKRGSVSTSLTKDEAVALMAYTMNFTGLYRRFNDAVHEGGEYSWTYRNKFPFKSLHFLLTRALQKLKPDKCQDVYQGVRNYHFEVEEDDKVRFGSFPLMSLRKVVAQRYGQDTMFKVHTCHGAAIQEFSYYQSEEEVLISPFETFEVIDVRKDVYTMHIQLRSTGTFSSYNCAWLEGGSVTRRYPDLPRNSHKRPRNSAHLPSNSPDLGGLLLATVAMAVVTGTL